MTNQSYTNLRIHKEDFEVLKKISELEERTYIKIFRLAIKKYAQGKIKGLKI